MQQRGLPAVSEASHRHWFDGLKVFKSAKHRPPRLHIRGTYLLRRSRYLPDLSSDAHPYLGHLTDAEMLQRSDALLDCGYLGEVRE